MARQLAVFFFAATVLLCETLLFHATKYVLDYVLAMAVISCAVAGIGLGAFLASRWSWSDRNLFGWCCGGTAASLYLAAGVLLRYPNLFLLLPAIASVFVCPSYFIACAFAQGSPRGVYLFDMLGAGMAVVLTVSAYQWLATEAIFLGVVTILPLVGAWLRPRCSTYRVRWRAVVCVALLACAGLGGALFYQQVTRNALSIARLVNPDAPNIPPQSVLRRPSRLRIERTYDSLIGRVEAIPAKRPDLRHVRRLLQRQLSDLSRPAITRSTRGRTTSAGRRSIGEWPMGWYPTPQRVCDRSGHHAASSRRCGKSRRSRRSTRSRSIPGSLQMMQRDYLDASGGAYRDLHVVLGNALSVLRRSDKKYDLITLINAHSSRWIGSLGPPDYLHTRESYDMYFDHLSEDGYLLFEERPDTYRGELGVKRMILTLWDCLKRRGVQDPAEHFFIWEFMSYRYHEQGLTGIAPGSDMYYVGMVVSLKPFVGQRREDLLEWCDLEWSVRWEDTGPVYVPCPRLAGAGLSEIEVAWGAVRAVLRHDRCPATSPGWGRTSMRPSSRTIAPSPSCPTTSIPEVLGCWWSRRESASCWAGCSAVGAMRGTARRGGMGLLLFYNVAIGFAYFFIEIMLIQAYQGVFLSPSASLVLVLGVLLIGSAIGGLLSDRVRLWWATAALVPVLACCLQIPAWTLQLDCPRRRYAWPWR